jgi:hypothetical protein
MRRALDEFVIEGIKPYHFIDNSWMIQDISEIIRRHLWIPMIALNK